VDASPAERRGERLARVIRRRLRYRVNAESFCWLVAEQDPPLGVRPKSPFMQVCSSLDEAPLYGSPRNAASETPRHAEPFAALLGEVVQTGISAAAFRRLTLGVNRGDH